MLVIIQVDPISRYKNICLVAEKQYSEILSQTSKISIGHITCKVLSWLNGHEHGVFAFARFGDALHTKLMHPNR